MYKVDIDNKILIELKQSKFGDLGLKERFDIQEWIEKTPKILGEDLLIISKEYPLPSGIRLDLLAVDKAAHLVVIELKRDDSGNNVEWQAIKYASYVSNFTADDIFRLYAEYIEADTDDAITQIEDFIRDEIEIGDLNEKQRIILCSREFRSDVASTVLWLRDNGIDVTCVKLEPYIDSNNQVFLNPDVIIPLPEAKDYVINKEIKKSQSKQKTRTIKSYEKSNYSLEELKPKVIATLKISSVLTPRLIAFIELLLSEDRPFKREEIKQELFNKGIGDNVGQAGRYLSNISQFITKRKNSHLRQIIDFQVGDEYTGGAGGIYTGETKDNYYILPEYRDLVKSCIAEVEEEIISQNDETITDQ